MRKVQEAPAAFSYELRNRSGGRRAEICETALKLFQQQGYTETSVQDIADAMGINKATLYHYLSSKQEILYELIRVIFDLALGQIQDIRNSPVSGAEKVRLIFESTFDRIERFGDHVTVFYREQNRLDGEHAELIRQKQTEFRRCMEDILAEARESHEFRDADPLAVRLTLQSLTDNAYVWYDPTGPLTPRNLADRFTDVVLRGLLPRDDGALA